MGVHADGSGVYWTEGSPDADQPHGLAYREFQDLRVGIRKRLQQEHVTFADATVGGTHKPGGTACLGMEITDSMAVGGDITAGVVQDGTYRGHGIVWSYDASQKGALYCCTADGTAAASWIKVQQNPAQIWDHSIVWPAKAQHFGSSICSAGTGRICGNTDVSGVLNVTGNVDVTGKMSIIGDISVYGDVKVCGTVAGVKTLYLGHNTRFWSDGSSNVFQGTDADDKVTFAMDTTMSATYIHSIAGDISFHGAGKLTCTTVNYWCSSEVDCSIGVGKFVTLTHSMGTSNLSAQLQCCTDAGAGTCSNSWLVPFPYPSTDTAIQIVDISTGHVTIAMGTGALFSSVCTANGAQTYWTTGWARVILTRLN